MKVYLKYLVINEGLYLKYLSINEGLLEIPLYKLKVTWNTSL